MSNLLNDFRLALRTVRRAPAYSAVAIMTLALAIGANTLIFSMANPLVIRGLPIAHAESVAWIRSANLPRRIDRAYVSVPDFIDYRSRAKSFASLAAYETASALFSGQGADPERVTIIRGTANLTDVWGMTPVLGRGFQPGDDAADRPAPALLSTRYWKERFGQDPGVIGRQFLLNGRPVVVTGVMPVSLELGTLSLVDFWTTMRLDPAVSRGDRTLRVLGRLAPGVTRQTAFTEISELARQQAAAYPDTNKDWEAHVLSSREASVGKNTFLVLTLLFVVVGFVLLIACANLANLVFARLTARRIELSVRQALGASRWQLVRPLLAEGVLLSVLGGAIGLAIAEAGLRVIAAVAYEPIFRQLTIDRNVLAFTSALSLLAPCLFCALPALSSGRSVRLDALRENRTSAGRTIVVRRNVLVAGQVALALALLVMSTLAVRSMLYLQRIRLGVDIDRVAMFRVELPADQFPDDAALGRFARELEAALSQIGGTDGAAVVNHLPVFDDESAESVGGLTKTFSEHEQPWVSSYAVTPGYFHTTGLPILAGRGFTDADRAGAEPVAILSQVAASRYFDGAADAIGRRLTIAHGDRPSRPLTVIGVSGDTPSPSLALINPQIYLPLAQAPARSMTALARAAAPASTLPGMRAVMRRLAPMVPITELETLVAKAREQNASNAILNGLFIAFAIVALVLAAGGLYGVISYAVGQRSREISVRLALGANPSGIRRMVLGDGLRVTLAGMAVGLILGLAIAKAASPLLEGVTPTDPVTFITVTVVVFVVAVLSVLGPAVRAMRLDPARTLRGE